jgi:hypothetical protein
MNPKTLQELFGNEIGRIYAFDGSIPQDENPQVHITEAFATAAGTNLVDCVVTQLSGAWLVYTRNTQVDSDTFRLCVELPLPEVVEETPETPTEETPNVS